jgi:hypothetical protein
LSDDVTAAARSLGGADFVGQGICFIDEDDGNDLSREQRCEDSAGRKVNSSRSKHCD